MSGGLIDRFPGDIEPLTAVVLATAVAAKSTWIESYGLAEGKYLARPDRKHPKAGEPIWASRLHLILASPQRSRNQILRSPVGDLAVHRMRTESSLAVTSVIARAEVPASAVLAAAVRIATGVAEPDAVSLFDLPLGHDELWSIEEEAATSPGWQERWQSYLPAWEARSTHDLLAMPLEIEKATGAIAAMLDASPLPPPQARQVAVARYMRTGFEAAAISTTFFLGSAMAPRSANRGVVRRATLRFNHPFAVVAVADTAPARGEDLDAISGSPWRGLPVFSGWVAEPSEAERGETPWVWQDEDAPLGGVEVDLQGPPSEKEPSPRSWWQRFVHFWSRTR